MHSENRDGVGQRRFMPWPPANFNCEFACKQTIHVEIWQMLNRYYIMGRRGLNEQEAIMVFKYKKELYPKIAVIKAAYHFTDVAYIHLDSDEEYYKVEITPKAGHSIEELDFENQILAQTARNEIYKQTKNIREIALARALASSVVENNEDDSDMSESISADDILNNWFDKNE